VTKLGQTETKRRYDDACGLAHALELIGERWAMLILRELAYGSRRFSELKADLPGISANVLTQRLTELEERGLVRKIRLPPPASVQVYEATPWALEVAPVIGKLGKWAARSPLHDPTLPLSHAAIMMSLETMIDAKRAHPFGQGPRRCRPHGRVAAHVRGAGSGDPGSGHHQGEQRAQRLLLDPPQ